MSLIYALFQMRMFVSQSTLKMLLNLNKETIFIVALEKMHTIGAKIVNMLSGELNTGSVFLE